MISLFGYDPAGDYTRITREIGMRRINLAVPEESLFLTKADRQSHAQRWQALWRGLGLLPNGS